jgi:ribosomal protein L33
VKGAGGAPKLTLKKYCKEERKHTDHKLKRK